MTQPHHFEFSRNWLGRDRLCGSCERTYSAGQHIEITTLRPYTKYVCPVDIGQGHSSIYTGAYEPAQRTPTDHLCACGLEYVEEDRERWLLTWEMQNDQGVWRPVERIGSRHSTEQQRDGLLDMPLDVRNVQLARLVVDESAAGLWPGGA